MTVPISIQLYTLREEAQRDFPAVIARLGAIGYAGVEPAGFHDLSPQSFLRCVEDAGLVLSGAHAPLPAGEHANAIFDAQQEIGNRDLVVAFLPPERFADRDAVRATADDLNAANESARERGLSLGYHNHWWEFANRIDGDTAHALLFQLLDPSVFAEIDTYWAQVGGADPVKIVADLGERARMLHLKDGPADDPKSPMTAVGEGVVDVPAIAAASRARWHVVELDRCATDMFDAVERSYRYLVDRRLARGRG
jgi:sugar phosphate isomerase/epimerase